MKTHQLLAFVHYLLRVWFDFISNSHNCSAFLLIQFLRFWLKNPACSILLKSFPQGKFFPSVKLHLYHLTHVFLLHSMYINLNLFNPDRPEQLYSGQRSKHGQGSNSGSLKSWELTREVYSDRHSPAISALVIHGPFNAICHTPASSWTLH